MPKVLFQLYIDVDQYEYLRRMSEETGRSRASIVREIIDKHRGTWPKFTRRKDTKKETPAQ